MRSFRLYWKLMMSPSRTEKKGERDGELDNSQDNGSEQQRHDIRPEGEREDRALVRLFEQRGSADQSGDRSREKLRRKCSCVCVL